MRPSPRGRYVYDTLTETANRTQRSLKAYLRQQHVPFESFWILNAIQVTGGSTVLQALAARPEVAKIIPDVVFRLPPDARGTREQTPNTVEWGVDRINAPQVWSTYNDRGENIVVGNVDTGVLYTHGALVAKYRGNWGAATSTTTTTGGTPQRCARARRPATTTATARTRWARWSATTATPARIRSASPRTRRGSRPRAARRTAARRNALLSSGQFMLAPTDLNGQNPQPNLRPDIVNNSWGNGNGGDTFYQAIVQAWVASGIFPSFASGNSGPGCGTVWSPGSYSESYAVGSFDINNVIAASSSRGPSPFGGIIKPNIAAPGVNVRSSWNNGGYQILSGTSMATPHLSATVALMWSAVPGAEAEHLGHGGDPESDGDRHGRLLWRHDAEQQHLGRGQARCARRRRRCSRRTPTASASAASSAAASASTTAASAVHRRRLRRHLRRLRLRLRRLRLLPHRRSVVVSRECSGCVSAPRSAGSGRRTARSAGCDAFARAARCAAVWSTSHRGPARSSAGTSR